MNTRVIFLLILFLWSINAIAQHNWNSRNWDKGSLGFGCGVGGAMTKPVKAMARLLADGRYDVIGRKLNSKVTAEQYLAVVVLEKLSAMGHIKLNDDARNRIAEIRKSDSLVPVCSGCMYWDEVPLRQLFTNTDEPISFWADYWFDQTLLSSEK